MVKINIAQRYKPFSHEPGAKCVLPGSTHIFQFFPSLLVVDSKEYPLKLSDSADGFTVQLDLERGEINVWCQSYRYTIGDTITVKRGDIKIPSITFIKNPRNHYTRLSLGSHKKQDWALMKRRQDLKEILPIWHFLGQQIPNEKSNVNIDFLKTFISRFDGIFFPRLTDDYHYGYNLSFPKDISPLTLLSEGAKQIEGLFIEKNENKVNIKTEFPFGRITNIILTSGSLDMEWSKKQIRRMIYRPEMDCSITFSFKKNLKIFRLREGNQDKGKIIHNSSTLDFKSGIKYIFDRFEK